MNYKLGFYSAFIIGLSTLLFAIAILIDNSWMSHFTCMVLSWGYVLLTCAFYTDTHPSRKSVALGGVAFAGLYATIINVVYFAQLSTVANNTASEAALQVLSYSNIGSLFFNLDMLGYGLMSLSTFLIGVAMVPDNIVDKWLKSLLMIHGIFLISSIAIPILNIFKDSSESSNAIGSFVLLFWCFYFIPVALLSAKHFHKGMLESNKLQFASNSLKARMRE